MRVCVSVLLIIIIQLIISYRLLGVIPRRNYFDVVLEHSNIYLEVCMREIEVEKQRRGLENIKKKDEVERSHELRPSQHPFRPPPLTLSFSHPLKQVHNT